MFTNDSSKRLSPYVAQPYSYVFGRSEKQLHYITIGDLLSRRAESEEKSKTAVISYHENISKTYEQLNSDVNQLVNGFYNKLGLRRGDVVGIWSCNCYAWIQIQLACGKLGLILCTINPVIKAQELNYTLRKSQISTLFMPGVHSKQEIVNQFHKVLDETLKLTDHDEIDPINIKQIVLLDGVKSDKIKFETELHLFESLLSNDNFNIPSDEIPFPEDPLMLVFTTGTTGKPKGALLSQFSVINNAYLLTYHGVNTVEKPKKLCLPLPLFHTGAGVLGGIAILANPIGLVLTSFKYDVKSIIDSIKINNCTHIYLTTTMIIDILNYVENYEISLDTLKGVYVGGAPVPIKLGHRIARILPSINHLIIGYGATEMVRATFTNKNDSAKNRTETVGTPMDFVELKIIDPKSGIIRKIGEKGELLCRGHNVMICYYRDAQKTKDSKDAGNWYKTGDLAVMDKFGYIKIIGRSKDMVIRGGENVYPREIEELLHTNPQVMDAYVLGVPDERLGEELCAWIKLTADSKLTVDDIKIFLKDKIAYYKVPRYVLFVDDMPLTPSGKPKKFVMRETSCELLGLKELQ